MLSKKMFNGEDFIVQHLHLHREYKYDAIWITSEIRGQFYIEIGNNCIVKGKCKPNRKKIKVIFTKAIVF